MGCRFGHTTHYGRLAGAGKARMNGIPIANISAMGSWNPTTQSTIYMPFASANDLAQIAGFPSAQAYVVPRLMLDPAELTDFQGMNAAIFPGLEGMLGTMRQVRNPQRLSLLLKCCCCILVRRDYVSLLVSCSSFEAGNRIPKNPPFFVEQCCSWW